MLANALESGRGRQPGENNDEEDEEFTEQVNMPGGSGGNADPFYFDNYNSQMKWLR